MDEKIIPWARFKGEANAGLSDQDMAKKGYVATASNVNVTDSGGVYTRVGYERIYTASGVAHSLFPSRNGILFRDGTTLKSYNIQTKAATTLVSTFLNQKLPVCYRDVDYKTYLMDGVTAGIVANGVYRSWGIPVVGSLFENYVSRMFIAFGGHLYYSRPFRYTEFDTREYISFDAPITMLEAVRTGLWVGTMDNIYFLAGDTPPFTRTRILDRGAIPGTAVKFAGAYISEQVHNEVVLWTNPSGIFMGGDEGYVTLVNKTPFYKPPRATRGNAFLRREQGLVQYIVFLEDATSNNEGNYQLKSVVNVLLPALTKT